MFFTTALLAVLAVPALALPKVETRQNTFPDYPYPAIEFTSTVPSQLCVGGEYTFHWTGGSGNYAFSQTLNYPNLPSTHPAVLVQNTTEHSWFVNIEDPKIAGSTYAFGVSDAKGVFWTDPQNKRFANTGGIPVAHC